MQIFHTRDQENIWYRRVKFVRALSDWESEAAPRSLIGDALLLQGFQDLCSEVGIPRGATIPQCKRALKGKLVNIIDLIDTRRTGKKVKIWTDFKAFKAYTGKLDSGSSRNKSEHLNNIQTTTILP
ncbi:hypothetical protein QBC37DRAFT_464277 [Rhypophila decipiens]|uniref:Uncharacterized protein n=1 Tax=Rhypophila decipiens TaxID=261697 RepID=A0AAN6YBX1_9PEZI|nr:hypothetical protein QBC37DRAFT_464277 [Rhypophila decipiens]